MPFLNKDNDKEFAVIGLGRFGGSLARRLEALGHPVLGVDIEPRLVKEISDEITEAVVLDATDEDALQQVETIKPETKHLTSDLLAGLTFALENIPQSMAHALLAESATVSNTSEER